MKAFILLTMAAFASAATLKVRRQSDDVSMDFGEPIFSAPPPGESIPSEFPGQSEIPAGAPFDEHPGMEIMPVGAPFDEHEGSMEILPVGGPSGIFDGGMGMPFGSPFGMFGGGMMGMPFGSPLGLFGGFGSFMMPVISYIPMPFFPPSFGAPSFPMGIGAPATGMEQQFLSPGK